jgi:hypothetical protein
MSDSTWKPIGSPAPTTNSSARKEKSAKSIREAVEFRTKLRQHAAGATAWREDYSLR